MFTRLLLTVITLFALFLSAPAMAEDKPLGDTLDRYQEGLYYLLGNRGYPKDPAKAAEIFQQLSTEQNLAAAKYMLASQYEKGNGISKNINKAYLLYKSAAEQGFATSHDHVLRIKRLIEKNGDTVAMN